jgi:hypothetical protein
MELPRFNRVGRALGGFSAAIYQSKPDQLWLLSDLPQGSLSIWDLALAGLAKGKELARPLPPPRELPLRGGARAALSAAIDAEAMVLLGDQLWVASEGFEPQPGHRWIEGQIVASRLLKDSLGGR